MILSLFLAALLPQVSEADYYTLEHFPTPAGELFEIGGMDFLADGRLVFSTRRGQVWIVDEPLADDVSTAKITLFAEGLWEGLGLTIVDDEIFVLQRTELSRLVDEDGDDVCDRIDTVSDDWGVSGNYHEFAFGLPRAANGNFFMALNVSFGSKWWIGKSPVPYRGWVLQVAPDGTTRPFASGFRSPCGLGTNAAGELFVTDNQGDWLPAGPIHHVQEGRWYGHPASLDWTPEYLDAGAKTSDEIPPARASIDRQPAALWLPYAWSRSAGNLVFDQTGGAFGPFGGQMFVAELTNGLVLRADLEKVRGEYQGACFLFRQQIGSVARVAFAPDGSLFCGLTNRGWGGLGPGSGLARVRPTGKLPLEMQRVHLTPEGFEVTFTKPLAPDSVSPADIDLVQYDYDYWWEYGSPERDHTPLAATATVLSADRRTLAISVPGIRPARVARARLFNVATAEGEALLHEEFAYTVNQLPEASGEPPTREHVARVVPPPPMREGRDEGWLMLTWGDALDHWQSQGWSHCDVDLDPDDPRRFTSREGNGAIANVGEAPVNFVSHSDFGDQELRLNFMLPQGGNSGVYLQGRYEIQLLDSAGKREVGYGDCGGIYKGATWPGSPPGINAFLGHGQWHRLTASFRAPRFDAEGNKTENARFLWVDIDGVRVQEDVEVPEVTGGALGAEVARGPLMLQGDHGPVAYSDIRIKPLWDETSRVVGRPDAADGWVALLPEDEDELDAWPRSGDSIWSHDGDVLIGEGPTGHLYTPRGDYTDIEVRARLKINDGGNSGLYVRTARAPEGSTWPAGYEAQVNSSFPDPQKTGSLYSLAPVLTHLVPPDTWFDYAVTCRDEADGTRVSIAVNGIVISDFLDVERRHAAGHLALQQHHEGSVIECAGLWVRELE